MIVADRYNNLISKICNEHVFIYQPNVGRILYREAFDGNEVIMVEWNIMEW